MPFYAEPKKMVCDYISGTFLIGCAEQQSLFIVLAGSVAAASFIILLNNIIVWVGKIWSCN